MNLQGHLIVASPALPDPFFAGGVIYIVAHEMSGADGLLINRQFKESETPFPLFIGGPIPSDGLMVIHGHKNWSGQEISPGIFAGDGESLANAAKLTAQGESPLFKVLTGVAMWGPGQLENEIAMGAWTVRPAQADFVFGNPESLWRSFVGN